MRYLFVSQYFWPEQFNITNLCEDLVVLGHEVTVLTGKPNYPAGRIFKGYRKFAIEVEVYMGIKIIRVPIYPRKDSTSAHLALNYISYIISACAYIPLLVRQNSFDIVFVNALSPVFQAIPGVILSRILKIPIIVWIQDLWPESILAANISISKSAISLLRNIVGFIYRRTSMILIQSRGFLPHLETYKIDRSKVLYVPNAYYKSKNDYQEPNHASKILSRDSSFFTVVFAGNLGKAQSLETILKAAKILLSHPRIKIYLIGDGSLYEYIRHLVETQGLTNIIMTGRLPKCYIEKHLPVVADCLLLSLSNNLICRTTIPSKLQFYLFLAKPIIGSVSGEAASIIREANAGLTSVPEDHQDLAEKILTLSNMPTGELQKMGRNGRLYYDLNFTPCQISKQIESVSHNLIRAKSK